MSRPHPINISVYFKKKDFGGRIHMSYFSNLRWQPNVATYWCTSQDPSSGFYLCYSTSQQKKYPKTVHRCTIVKIYPTMDEFNKCQLMHDITFTSFTCWYQFYTLVWWDKDQIHIFPKRILNDHSKMLAIKRLAAYSTRGGSQGMYITFTSPMQIKAAHSGFQLQRRRHQKSKTEVPVTLKCKCVRLFFF